MGDVRCISFDSCYSNFHTSLKAQLAMPGGLMILNDTEIDQIVNTIVEEVRPRQIILFGSYARGSMTEDSDLDLLVIMDTEEPSYKRSARVRCLLWPPKAPMDVLVYTTEEVARFRGLPNHVLTDVLNTGNVLYAA